MWGIPFIFGGLLLSGLWIAVSLGMIGIIVLYFFGGGSTSLSAAIIATWNLLYNFSLSALPLYIFLGEIFVVSGLAHKGYDAIAPLLERFPGKLLLSNVVIDALFGAIVGTSMATAATVGSIAYPELSKRGYNRTALVGNLAGAGTLGSYVPPSVGLIVYGAWVQLSVGSLFAAAIFPAFTTVALFLIFLTIYCKVRPDIVPAGEVIPLKRAIIRTKGVWPMMILILSIVGTIYFGIATPTEAAGVAVIITLIMSVGFRTFGFRKLYDSLTGTATICGMIFLIMTGAAIFSISLSVIGLPRQIVLGIQALELSPIMIIGSVYVLYLILGCFFEFFSMLLMTIPFTYPLMMSIGVDPLWFGIVLVITGEMGMLTPPVGMNLYVLQGVTQGEVSLGEVAKGSIPYFLMLGVTLGLITIFPQLCTWLPARMK